LISPESIEAYSANAPTNSQFQAEAAPAAAKNEAAPAAQVAQAPVSEKK
jgi:hypothetical protein